MRERTRNPLPIAALTTGLVAVALSWTQTYEPPGSPVAWLLMIALAVPHLLLVMRPGRARAAETEFPLPPGWLFPIVAGVVLAGTASLAFFAAERIYQEPVLPKRSAQLGLMTQVVDRFFEGDALYHHPYRRDGYVEGNAFLPGMVVPFAAARARGYDWRFASLVAVALMGAVLCAGALALEQISWRAVDEIDGALAAAGMAAAGAAWLFLSDTATMIQWAHVPPLWPLLALLGVALAAREYNVVAFSAGILAAMNPGWVLMLPVVSAMLWRQQCRVATFALLLLPPLVSYGLARHEWNEMLRGVLEPLFLAGKDLAKSGTTYRYPTLHALGDFLMLRPAIYAMGLVAVCAICVEMVRSESRMRRVNLLAAASFVVIATGPVAYFFHWVSHAVLLAGLVPAACLAAQEENTHESGPALPIRGRAFAFGATCALCIFLFALAPLRWWSPSILLRKDLALRPDENLFHGWNATSGDHTWGRETRMATGFVLDEPVAGLLEIRIGTLGGEFTPYNPITISVNGRPKNRFFIQPGDIVYARVSLGPHDVLRGFNVVEFDCEWARTPRSTNVYPDDRVVSLYYAGMKFIPLDRLPPEVQLAQQQTSRLP